MSSDPFPPARGDGPLQGTAAIAAVTSDMMDEAAHKAAEAADALAHRPDAVVESRDPLREAAGDDAAAVAGAIPSTPEIGDEGARDVFEAAAAAVTDVAREADDSARDAMQAGEAAFPPAADALTQYGAKVLEIIQSNVAAAATYVTDMMGATSVPEAMTLNADHLRRHVDSITAQSRELASLAQRLTFEAMQPIKETVASRFRDR